ncbi:MAG: hypothetical protein ACRBFS_13490 [Aureispira sp.]
MKTVSQFLTLAILFALAISCGSNSNEENAATVVKQEKKLDIKANRGAEGGQQAIARFSLEGIQINVEELEVFKVQTAAAAADADAMKLMRVNESLMAAEKEAQILDVNFSMSDEPVGNGMFVFSIESPDNKGITLEMFDEEGYNLAANNTFVVNEGNNYKALNVNSLDNGDYLFRLKDDQGRELARTVSIDHKEEN